MSYFSRVYRQRNAHIHDEPAKEPFFAQQNDVNSARQRNTFFQAKLSVNEPGDKYEREADAVADTVVNPPSKTSLVQQKEAHPEKEKKKEIHKKDIPLSEEEKKKKVSPVQTKQEGNVNTVSPQLSSQIENSAGNGNSLSQKTLHEMDLSFGVDFGSVKVHNDSKAAQMNKELQAQAFTHGNDIYFNSGKYNPENKEGKFLLAHELTHVVQQNGSGKAVIEKKETPLIQNQVIAAVHDYVQRTHIEGGRKKFDCPDFSGDLKLEACLNDEDRLSPFETGESVIKVQEGLQRDGMDLGADGTEGAYGADTGKAVKAFKQKHNLGFTQFPDVGPGTMAKLDELCVGAIKPDKECPPCSGLEARPSSCPPCPAVLPEPEKPDVPPGPVIPPGAPFEFCVPFLTLQEALQVHPFVAASTLTFAAKFGKDVQDLYAKYLFNPKSGKKGTLPPRKVFADQQSRVVKEFRQDPETQKQARAIMKLLAEKIKNNPALMPLPGQSTPLLDFRAVLTDKELLDLPMSFGDPGNKIPGFIAGGPAKGIDASDAGDDVRNVDGKFVAINIDPSQLIIRAAFTFDVFDCVDFCPGASGSGLALGLTIPISKLEATPDAPTFDVPFEVVYGLSDDQSF